MSARRDLVTPQAAAILRRVFAAAGVELARDAEGLARLRFSGRAPAMSLHGGESSTGPSCETSFGPQRVVIGGSRPSDIRCRESAGDRAGQFFWRNL